MTERQDDNRQEERREQPVIRDRRRIDPVTGEPREHATEDKPAAAPGAATATAEPDGAAADPASAEVARLRGQLDERTADLQRLQAEYANYRKRVERDRAVVRDLAVASVLSELLPVVDDVGRAREHGELEGGFKSVGESLESILGKFGLQQFGQRGEPFDPAVHEALVHSYSAEVTEATCVEIFQPGYRLGERVIRPARVAVAEPEAPAAPAAATPGEAAPAEDGPTAQPTGATAAGEASGDATGSTDGDLDVG